MKMSKTVAVASGTIFCDSSYFSVISIYSELTCFLHRLKSRLFVCDCFLYREGRWFVCDCFLYRLKSRLFGVTVFSTGKAGGLCVTVFSTG